MQSKHASDVPAERESSGQSIDLPAIPANSVSSENQVRGIGESALDACVEVDSSGAITHWNTQAENTLGWSSLEVLGRHCGMIFPSNSASLARLLDFTQGNQSMQTIALHRDGRELP